MMPDLFEFLDYRAYLKQWFKAENELREREGRIPLTHRAFHEMAGISNGGTLIQILEYDRRLTPSLLNSFLLPLEIEPGSLEERYLSGLVELEAAELKLKKAAVRHSQEVERGRRPEKVATTRVREPRRHKSALVAAERAHQEAQEQRAAVLTRLRALREQARAHPIAGREEEILGSLLSCAVLELARAPGFQADPGWIAARLRIPATSVEIEDALRALRAAEVLTDQGVLAPVFRTEPRVPAHAVQRYYPAVGEAAARAMAELFGPQRLEAQRRQRLGALTVAIPASKVADFDRLLLHLQEEVARFLSGLEGDRDLVYQIYLHLFPLSKGPGEDSDED